MLAKNTRSLMVIALVLALTACAGGPARSPMLSLQDLDDYQIDCARKAEQLDFLMRQLPSRDFERANRLAMHSVTGQVVSGMDGSYSERYNHAQGFNQAVVRRKISYLQTYCP